MTAPPCESCRIKERFIEEFLVYCRKHSEPGSTLWDFSVRLKHRLDNVGRTGGA